MTVRSALVRSKGVKEAKVSFSTKEAIVTYDPKQTFVAAIIKVVNNTPSMMGGGVNYGAKVQKGH